MKAKSIILFAIFALVSLSCAQEDSKAEKKQSEPAVAEQKITMVELGSVNCIPCRAMSKVMDSLQVVYPTQLEIRFHDVWTPEGKPYARKYGIRSIPTQVFLDAKGQEIHRHEGFYPQNEIIAFLSSRGLQKK